LTITILTRAKAGAQVKGVSEAGWGEKLMGMHTKIRERGATREGGNENTGDKSIVRKLVNYPQQVMED
jgi:hypothetical protein